MSALVLGPVLFLGALELGLRLIGYGYPTHFFRTISAGPKRLVVENDKFSWRFFPRQLARRPLPISFSPDKPAGTYRIFVLGESAAMGDPDPAFGFSRILKVLLEERFPSAHFELINAAFTAINSHVILPIARDCAAQHGDLWVIYMGHNEVQGPFGPGTVFGAYRSRLWLTRATIAIKATRVGQLLEALQARLSHRDKGPAVWHGLEMFLQNQIRETDPRLDALAEQFKKNLDDTLRTARHAGAEVVLCTPASNLKDSAPFASLHAAGLSADRKPAWDELYRNGVNAQTQGQLRIALGLFQAAAELDSGYADLHFRLGQCALALEQPGPAREFERARDLDTLRFRADSRLLGVVQNAAERWQNKGVALCDTRAELGHAAPAAIPGEEFFFDHVHLTPAGNYVLARAMADQVIGRLPAALRAGDRGRWAEEKECARRLGLTDWNLFQMYDVMQRRLLEAPFTNQLNHSARQQFFAEQLTALRPALQGDPLRACAELSRAALAQTPDDPRLHENLGKILAALGDDAGAISQFQKVAEIWPQSPTAFNNIGLLLQKQGHPDEAETYFKQALARRPEFADAYNGLGLIQAGRKNWPAAAELYRRALVDNPELVEAHANLAHALQEEGDLAGAAKAYQEALRLRSSFVPAQLGIADVLLQQHQAFEAIPHLAEAAKLQPQAALARVAQSVQLHPDNPIEHFKRANVLASLQRSAEALESLRTAVRLDPNFWEARYLLGVELAGQNRIPEAEEQFAAVVRLRPEYARARVNLGVALAKESKLQEAAAQFQEALRLEPTNRLAEQFLEKIKALSK